MQVLLALSLLDGAARAWLGHKTACARRPFAAVVCCSRLGSCSPRLGFWCPDFGRCLVHLGGDVCDVDAPSVGAVHCASHASSFAFGTRRLVSRSACHASNLACGSVTVLALLPVVTADLPQGVDWVGFTALAHHLTERGAFASASGHQWLYPPGFPALLAFLAHVTGFPAERWSGHWSIHPRCSAAWHVLRRGPARRGGEGILAMMLAVGVFSKVLDSGWPTVLSLVLIPANLGGCWRWTGHVLKSGWCFLSAIASAFLHPAGAFLLMLLLMADVASQGLAKGPLDRLRLDLGVLFGLVVLLFGVALLSQDVRLDAPFAEDGWQGGWPMLAYGSPLVGFAAWAGWRLRGFRESRLLVLWLVLTWGLSLVQLLPDGARGAALTNLGSGLYAMDVRFPSPAAALVALWWSDSTSLRGAEASPSFFVVEGDPCPLRPLAVGLVVLVMLASVAATGAMARLWVHDETLALAPGDVEVAERLHAWSGKRWSTPNKHHGVKPWWFQAST